MLKNIVNFLGSKNVLGEYESQLLIGKGNKVTVVFVNASGKASKVLKFMKGNREFKNNFHNVYEKLSENYQRVFPKPQGSFVFKGKHLFVEDAVVGQVLLPKKENFEKDLKTFCKILELAPTKNMINETFLLKRSKLFFRGAYGKGVFDNFSTDDRKTLRTVMKTFFSKDGILFPFDITHANIIVGGDEFKLIDCDYFAFLPKIFFVSTFLFNYLSYLYKKQMDVSLLEISKLYEHLNAVENTLSAFNISMESMIKMLVVSYTLNYCRFFETHFPLFSEEKKERFRKKLREALKLMASL